MENTEPVDAGTPAAAATAAAKPVPGYLKATAAASARATLAKPAAPPKAPLGKSTIAANAQAGDHVTGGKRSYDALGSTSKDGLNMVSPAQDGTHAGPAGCLAPPTSHGILAHRLI
jgi:hypothetical protein